MEFFKKRIQQKYKDVVDLVDAQACFEEANAYIDKLYECYEITEKQAKQLKKHNMYMYLHKKYNEKWWYDGYKYDGCAYL